MLNVTVHPDGSYGLVDILIIVAVITFVSVATPLIVDACERFIEARKEARKEARERAKNTRDAATPQRLRTPYPGEVYDYERHGL